MLSSKHATENAIYGDLARHLRRFHYAISHCGPPSVKRFRSGRSGWRFRRDLDRFGCGRSDKLQTSAPVICWSKIPYEVPRA